MHLDDRANRPRAVVTRLFAVGDRTLHQGLAARVAPDATAGAEGGASATASGEPAPAAGAAATANRRRRRRHQPSRLPSLEVRLLAPVLLATGSRICSPAFRPLRMIVELLPARPVTTRWRTSLPPRTTVTMPPEMALVGTFTPSA